MSEPHPIELLSDEAFGWYFTGLADGEASFMIRKNNSPTSQYENWRAAFTVKMRADEHEHLSAVARRMRCGKVAKYNRKPSKINGKPFTLWTVHRHCDLVDIIIPHFEKFPLQFKKARDFIIWKPCAIFLRDLGQRRRFRRHSAYHRTVWTPEDVQYVSETVALLKSTRLYDSSIVVPIPTVAPKRKEHLPLFPD